ncbi:thermonuclease family protein [Pseudorhodobacter sp. E13]|uniref:thermonuclease family protein n=1 Tax=Pseudorhodobacter sp. E13 TaxID=2487931 RepID=UPI000F8C97BE|nr:thermonuclease family protein [Pseudorhodobacter sp. E13]RUS63556.1 thermonuclease family protein [Pseudorhodobacter sp. E13]
MLTFRSALVLFLLAVTPAQALTLSGQAVVTDGDSLRIGAERIRLFGIDAPELKQRCDPSGRNWACGKWAKDALQQIVSQGVLRCEAVEKDRYGRTVARCMVGQRDVAALMVRAGAATAFTRYSTDYVAQERAAKAEARGLWSGAMTAPGDYRQIAKRGSTAPSGCVIKGNISAKGARIYHMPGQRDYAATKISPSKGEAFFCSEAQARAAGFRAAKR